MTMTSDDYSAHEQLARRQRYRRLFWACFAVAIGGFFAGVYFGFPLAGLAVYWAGVVGMLAVWKGSPVEVFDERERSLERRTSQITISLFGFVLIAGSPGRILVAELGYAVPVWFSTVMWAYAAIFVVYGAVYLVIRYRP